MTTEPVSTDPPWEPPLSGTEVEHLLGALDRLRWTFRWKAGDLGADGLGQRLGGSTLTLGGLVKHLAVQEDYCTAVKISGAPMPSVWDDNGWDDDEDWELTSAAGEAPERLYALYDDAVARARETMARVIASGGLDQAAAMELRGGGHPSVRRLVFDLVEEYGRHTGHADLLREAVDGRVGEDPPGDWRPRTIDISKEG